MRDLTRIEITSVLCRRKWAVQIDFKMYHAKVFARQWWDPETKSQN
jgi:hypothetical protein